MKGVTTLNLPDIAVTGDGKQIKLVATDKNAIIKRLFNCSWRN